MSANTATYPAPDADQVRALWDQVQFTEVDRTVAHAEPVLNWLQHDRPKGGAHLQGFKIHGSSEFEWFARDHLPGNIAYILPHPDLRTLLPDSFGITDPLSYKSSRRLRGWHYGASLELAPQWARAMYSGGFQTDLSNLSNEEQDSRAHRALENASNLYSELFGNRYSTISFATSPDPWCAWFPGLFNITWAVHDRLEQVLWLLAVTDMD
ncbi:hypothetical protein ABT324_24390 [Saccharopolyspora sp. NPDC000359]|uniref:hypothetical protein n=1 Tax=Saccharopolyspora sp. NPDC000359 TaxID=3154251 RepID=UPI003319EC67